MRFSRTLQLLLLPLALGSCQTCLAALPSPRVPDGLGVNIHFLEQPANDLDMIHKAGFRFVRMDFMWSWIEKSKGVYDFSRYDGLVNELHKRGMRTIFIHDDYTPIYEPGKSVQTDTGREALAKFAATAAKRYAGKGIVWELWNEPNIDTFWEPQPSLNDYMAMVKVVAPSIRRGDPKATIIGPGMAWFDMPFIEGCFKQGLLKLVDAVSLHPYRDTCPETAIAEYQELRALIRQYQPDYPDMPIVCSEWGYTTVWKGITDDLQGQYLEREFLVNLSLDIPLSIYYDWHDDGTDPNSVEHHYGTVYNDYRPKPAYQAMQRLTKALRGLRFHKRLPSADGDYLLLFTNGHKKVVAAWTTMAPHAAKAKEQLLSLDGNPQYVLVK